MKRAFKRIEGVASDTWEEKDGQRIGTSMATSLLGEGLTSEEKGTISSALRSDPKKLNVMSLYHSDLPASQEELLELLEKGELKHPEALLEFIDEPGVRFAITQLAKHATVQTISGFTRLLKTIGGEDSLEILESYRVLLNGMNETWEEAPTRNERASSLCNVVAAILRLHPDSDPAAEALLRLLRHKSLGNQREAVREASTLVVSTHQPTLLRTTAMQSIRAGLRMYVDNPEPKLFINAVPALIVMNVENNRVFQRCKELLSDPSGQYTRSILSSFQKLPGAYAITGILLLKEQLEHTSSLLDALFLAIYLKDLVPTETRRRIVLEALAEDSPFLRQYGISLLSHMSPQERRKIAKEASVDEPDPALQEMLQRYKDEKQ